jgi:hypothetical protein
VPADGDKIGRELPTAAYWLPTSILGSDLNLNGTEQTRRVGSFDLPMLLIMDIAANVCVQEMLKLINRVGVDVPPGASDVWHE